MSDAQLSSVSFARNYDGSWDWCARDLESVIVASNQAVPTLAESIGQFVHHVLPVVTAEAPPPKKRRRRGPSLSE